VIDRDPACGRFIEPFLYFKGYHALQPIVSRVFLYHATGFVVGSTAVIDDDVSILQNVTLGGTGKEASDRQNGSGAEGVQLRCFRLCDLSFAPSPSSQRRREEQAAPKPDGAACFPLGDASYSSAWACSIGRDYDPYPAPQA